LIKFIELIWLALGAAML